MKSAISFVILLIAILVILTFSFRHQEEIRIQDVEMSFNEDSLRVCKLAYYIRKQNKNISLKTSLEYSRYFYEISEILDENEKFVEILVAMVQTETNFNAKSISGKGARGISQFMPNTAKEVANRHNITFHIDSLENPRYSIYLQGMLVQELLYKYGVDAMLVSYNGGTKHGRNWKKGIYDSIPTESKNYVKKVNNHLRSIRKCKKVK